MPILTRFPGGGGATGYKYQSEGAGGITYSRDAGGALLLRWTDPADMVLDGRALAEWKGTLVVCKEGSPPQSVDDGTIVCDSTVRDQYRETGLPVDVGGPGYYYGVFPYTRDYVVNVDSANTVYVLSEGYDATLRSASWQDINYIVSRGEADQIWKVGDEIDVVLSGDYTGSITMQIAGFDHDDLVEGGKAGITFLSKQLAIKNVPMDPRSTNTSGWGGAHLRTVTVPKIRSSLPQTVKDVIKKVNKSYTFGGSGTRSAISEDDLFIPSCAEVGKTHGSLPDNEGAKYPIFVSDADLVKKDLYGNDGYWWLRSASKYDTSCFGYVRASGGITYGTASSIGVDVCFGFCI